MDAAIGLRLAKLWPVVRKDRAFIFQIDHNGQHTTGGIVVLGDPVARSAWIELISLAGDIDHARDGAGQRIRGGKVLADEETVGLVRLRRGEKKIDVIR